VSTIRGQAEEPAGPIGELPASRRGQQKIRTRHALRDAALLLFATKGYEETTMEEIADAAGVSPRTVFRYFPTKDSLLYFRDDDWVLSVIAAFLEESAELSDIDAMCAAFCSSVLSDARGRRVQLRYRRAVQSSVTLRGLEHDHRQLAVEMIADAVASRRGLSARDSSCELVAAVATLTYRRAVDRWLSGSAKADVRAMIVEEFRLLDEVVRPARSLSSGPGAAPRRKTASTRRR